MAYFSIVSAKDAPITKDFTKITLPDGTVEVVRKIGLADFLNEVGDLGVERNLSYSHFWPELDSAH